jgi:hypothetical protein
MTYNNFDRMHNSEGNDYQSRLLKLLGLEYTDDYYEQIQANVFYHQFMEHNPFHKDDFPTPPYSFEIEEEYETMGEQENHGFYTRERECREDFERLRRKKVDQETEDRKERERYERKLQEDLDEIKAEFEVVETVPTSSAQLELQTYLDSLRQDFERETELDSFWQRYERTQERNEKERERYEGEYEGWG